MRYILNYGSANTLGNPAWTVFQDALTLAALPEPVVYENTRIPGQYYFDIYWAGIPAATTKVGYGVNVNGVVLTGTVDRPAVDGMTVSISPAAVQTLSEYPTAKTVINRAAIQCSQAESADPFAETNPDYVLLREMLTSLSRDIMKGAEEGWTHLVQTATFVTDGVSTAYALPAGFRAMVDGTLWNRSTRLPGIGPVSSQQRAALQARLVQVVLSITYRVEGNLMTFPVVSGAGSTIAFDFYSNNWAASAGAITPDKDRATAATDVLLFDEELLVSGLVLRWLENRGFDTAKAQERFNGFLEDALGRNSGATVIAIGGTPRFVGDRMVGGWNVPEGNWPT